MEDLNKKIKELRNVLGMTQAQFAEKLELTQSNLSAIEGGKREVNLTDLLKTPINLLLNRERLTKEYIKMKMKEPIFYIKNSQKTC